MPTCPCLSTQSRHRRRPPSDIAKRRDVGWPPCTYSADRRVGGETRLKRNVEFARLAGLLAAAVMLAVLLGCQSKVSGDVMATVDGRKIFRSDVDKYYENQVASAQQAPAGEQATILRLNILRQLIDDEMVMRRAEKLGLLATEEEVDRKLNEIKSPYTQEEFDLRLKEKKISLEDFKRDIRRSITVDKVMNKEVSSKISVTDQDTHDYLPRTSLSST